MITKAEGNVLTLERVFDAPRELVFKVFSEAEHLKQWWGPRGWTLTVCNVDFRPGGVWHYCMNCIDFPPRIRFTLIELEGKTKIINRAQYVSAEALKKVMEMGMEQGITETWDRLEEHLQSLQ